MTVWLALLALAVSARPVQAAEPEPLDAEQMDHALHFYFDDEKQGAIAFITAGSLSLVGGGIMVAFDHEVVRPAAYPMLAIGALHVAVGSVLLARTDAQAAALSTQLASDPRGYLETERARIERVEKSFVWLEILEAALVISGVVTAAVGFVEDSPFAQGFGVSLAGEALLSLGFDLWAADRARLYADALDGFAAGLSVGPDGAVGLVLGTRW